MTVLNNLHVKSKIWIEVEDEPLIGEGRLELLRAIGELGSISKASEVTGVPYRRVWSYVKLMEERLHIPLVRTFKGGSEGGGARLTKEAERLIEKFDLLQEGLQSMIDQKFKEVFFDS